ncbi:amino acid adenylation domain-containing protein, partial [Pedobacter sp. UYP1]|uniref:amino acid adenylation domain-containing protein n=1 Tax=Pedobacter sp. UYP1 TaxID=1756396 RepID=UPI003393557B
MNVLDIQKGYELSLNQKELWNSYNENINHYYNQLIISIDGPLDEIKLLAATESIISRHEVLSSKCIFNQASIFPSQISFEDSKTDFFSSALLSGTISDVISESNKYLDFPYNPLSNEPVRFYLGKLYADKSFFVMRLYSLWGDSYSCDLFYKELYNEYFNLEQEENNIIIYSNFSQWQNDLTNEPDEVAIEFWKNYNNIPKTDLFPLKERKESSFSPQRVELLNWGGDKYKEINSLSVSLNSGINDLLFGVFGSYLTGFSDEEITIGYTPFKRNYNELDYTLGLVTKTLPVKFNRNDNGDLQKTVTALKQVIDEVISLSDYFYLENPAISFFDFCFEYIEVKTYDPVNDKNIHFQRSDYYSVTSTFLVKLFCVDYGDRIAFDLYYDQSRISPVEIQLLSAQLKQRLENVFTGKLNQLSDFEEQIISAANFTDQQFNPDLTVLDLFETQVSKNPDHIAIVHGGNTITYKELDERSGQLAGYLKSAYTIKCNDLIGIILERSPQMIIAILGIIKSGAAYVPIDPEYPQQRINYILSDSRAKLLICEKDSQQRISKETGIAALCIDDEFPDGNDNNTLLEKRDASDLAYIIYTSGSTGKPKGCLVTHANLANYIQWSNAYYFEGNDFGNWGFITSISFDLTVTSLYTSLTRGKKIIIPDSQHHDILSLLEDSFTDPDVDTLKLTPSHLSLLNGLNISKTNVSIVICGGEQLLPEQLNAVWKINKNIIIYNEYGPTETTVGSLIKRIEKDDSRILIGKPIANTRVYLLDDKNLMSPIGQPGEICIGGNGVSDGYLNNPELTKERFIVNPLNPSEKIYRTGDIGRWDADGNIELFGRKDDQIKIHGYRIEPGEIETALQRHPAIETAAVIARFTAAGEQELVAYIVSKEKIDITGLRAYVYENLPVYMLPNKFVRLEALPLTTNGKLDRKALPDPEGLEIGGGADYLAPRNDLEEHLVSIFAEVLKKDSIGVKDNFFALGGDSIKSIQMVSRIKKRGYALTVRDVMQHPVLEDLARQLKLLTRITDQGVVTGTVVLSPIQHYFLSRTNVNPHHFNQSVLLESKITISESGLRAALDKLVAHHDALRMVYQQELSGWKQENLGLEHNYSLEIVTVIPEGFKFEEYCNQVQAGFDLSSGPLFKAVLFHGESGDRLLLVCHHLVIDGISWRILFEDLSALYGQYSSGLALELPQKTDSFLYWQHQLGLYAGSATLQKERAYWNEINSIALTSLERDYKDGSNLVRDISSASFTLDQEETTQLMTACYHAYQTDTNDILLTGLSLALKDIFGLKRVLVNLEGHGREDIGTDIDVSRTVGWFTTIYPVLLDLGETGELISSLVSVKESLHRIPNKGIGYGILAAVGEEEFSAVHPEITFNYLGDFGSGVEGANGEELFSFSGEAHGNDVSGEMSRWEVLNISGIVAEGCLRMSISYSQQQYSAAKITRLLKSYAQNLTSLIKVLAVHKQTLLTPVDLTYNNLSLAQVHVLNSDYKLSDVYALSPLQEGLYYHWLSNPSSSAYFEQMSYRLQGALNLSELSSAYEALVSRHAVLRTYFVPDLADRPLQVITKAVNSLVYIDASKEKYFSVEDYKLKDREKGFDLHSGSQMRLTVLFLGDNTYEFIWSHHHILMDGWCVSILIKEFFQLYECLLSGKDALLPVVHPYADYVKWLMALDKEVSIGYWQKYLSGYEPLTGLPKKTSAKGDYNRQHNSLRLEGDLRLAVKKLCEKLSVTENTFIQTIWGILLSSYNYKNDIVFGAVVSGRPGEIPGIEGMIGLFINTIPVRIEIEEDNSFSELLKSVQNSAVESSDYHYTQLATIQSAASHGQALFDHILVFENYPVQELVARELEEEDNSLSLLSSEIFEQTGYDLSLIILPGAVIEVHFEYNGNVYEDSAISRVTSHLMQLISGVVTDPSVAVKDLDCLSAAEQFQLLESFNDTALSYPKDQTLVNLFEQQVVISANATALVFEDRDLSYAALNSLANQLGNYLRSIYQVKPNELIGICLERSEWMVIAILGILKAGGAYVPIDPGYPQERIDYMLTDSDCKVVIDEAELIKFRNSLVAYSTENLEVVNSPEDLAYVIYTSGTTGNPKGALLAHYNVVSLLKTDRYLFDFNAADVWTMFHSYCFDFSVWEMYGALLYGGKLIVVGAATAKDPQVFLKLLSESKVTVLNQTPSSFYNLQQELSGSADLTLALRYVIFGGEALSPGRLLSWKQIYPDTLLVNMYGITETTVHVTYKEIGIAEIHSGISNIGKAIPTLNCYVLDKNEHLLPVGVWGELYVGGAGVCQGYLNLADLTTSRFVQTSFSGSGRLYRSGDKVRLLENGEMEYGGRLDNQVKIRGYRIELGEIEESLRSYPGIDGVVVTVRGGAEKELVAYVVSKYTLSVTTLRSHLSTILPDYMLPAHFVQIDHIPLNSNGKTDRKSLPDPSGLGLGTGIEYIAPRNAAEQVLCAVFSDVLKKEGIGVKDNFFALGGDSIKSIQVVSRLRPRGYVLTVGDVMQHPVLEDLARQVKLVSRVADQGLVTGRVELSPIQRYFLEGTATGHHHFNQSVLLESKEDLSESGLRAVLEKLVSHHDALRMVYREGLSGWEQENLGLGSGYSLEVVTVTEGFEFEAYC